MKLKLVNANGRRMWFSGTFYVASEGDGETTIYVVLIDSCRYEFPQTVANMQALDTWADS